MKRKIPTLLPLALLRAVFPRRRSPHVRRAAVTRCCGPVVAARSRWQQFFCQTSSGIGVPAIRRPALPYGAGAAVPARRSSPPSRRTSEPEQPSEPSGSASVSSYEQQVAALVNAERAKYGLAALTLDETLCGYALVKSQDMHDQRLLLPHQPDLWLPV